MRESLKVVVKRLQEKGIKRVDIARNAGMSVYQLNNDLSADAEVLQLVSGDYVKVTNRTVIYKVKDLENENANS